MDSASPIDPTELLLEHAEWVRALARSLVRDPGAAEDLAQETWLAALRRAPGDERPTRAWLAAVLKNAARQAGRAGRRRSWRERRAARPEALPSDAELGERVALQRWVVEQLMALDEPYRRTILLRFFEGLPPREIALRLGVPLETVKSRLRRGLGRLRERMSSRRGPNGECGVLALLPLAGPKLGSGAGGAGVVLMGKKVLWVAALALVLPLAGVLFVELRGGGSQVVEGLDVGEIRAAEEPAPAVAAAPAPLTGDALAPRLAVGESFRVRAVLRESGRPLADTVVRLVPWRSLMRPASRNGSGESIDIEAAAAALARPMSTDARGELRLPAPSEFTLIVARRGGLFGQTLWGPGGDETVEVQLIVDRSLTLQAVTAAGEPLAGVSIGVAKCSDGYAPRILWWALTSGEEGLVTLRHVDQTLEGDLEQGVDWAVTLATPWPNPPLVHVDARALPTEPVQLVVEPGARVLVRVEDGRGELVRAAHVYLRQVDGERDGPGRGTRPRRHHRWSPEGVALFEGVAPGLELLVTAEATGYRAIEEVVSSPDSAGEELVVTLRFEQREPRVRATLLDSSGAPLVGREVDVRAFFRAAEEDDRYVTGKGSTDARGEFEVFLVRAGNDALREFVFTTDEAYEGQTLAATVLGRDPPADDVYDLGPVRLEPPPKVLTGRVTDEAGQPIFWAGIWAKRMAATNDVEGPPYTWIHEWQTQTDADGRFELTGDQGPGDYRLSVSKQQDGYLVREDIPFQPGTRGLEVVLHKNGGLEGSLRLSEDIPTGWLRVSVARSGSDSAPAEPLRPRADGKFFLLGLVPGAVDVTVSLPAWRTPLVRVTDVAVEGGVTRADARLANLDLRSSIQRIDLELRDPEGAAVPEGCVAFRSPEGEEGRVAFLDGAASLLAPSPTLDVELIAPGFRPLSLDGVQDGMLITLERGLPVRVRLPEGFELPAPPAVLSLELTPADMPELEQGAYVHAEDGSRVAPWRRERYGVTASFTDSREATLWVGGPGAWEVAWTLTKGRSSAGVRGARPHVIEVEESGPAQPVVLAPDAESLAAKLAGLK